MRSDLRASQALKPPAARTCRYLLCTDVGSFALDDLSLLHVATGVALDADWPSDVLEDMTRLACSQVSSWFEEALGAGWRVVRGDVTDRDCFRPWRLTLRLPAQSGSPQSRHLFVVEAASETVESLLRRSGWQALEEEAARTRWEALVVPLNLWYERLVMPLGALRSLRAGNIVMLRESSATVAPRLHAQVAGARIDFSWTGAIAGAVRFEGWSSLSTGSKRMPMPMPMPMPMQSDMQEADGNEYGADVGIDLDNYQGGLRDADPGIEEAVTSAAKSPGQAPPLDGLELELQLVAGRVRLTLGELRALAPGAVLHLQHAATAQVDLVVNETRIGRGELVDVSGRLAVEILDMNGPSPHAQH